MRDLTVSSIYQPRRRGGAVSPHLRLSGRWLESAGFAPGTRVRVQVQQGQLVITTEAAS
jgi:toxic protein SymE